MKKEIFIHFAFLISFFIFVSLARGWLSLTYWPLWAGAILGTILPDLDHLLYVFFLRPQELTSQRSRYLIGKKDLWGLLKLLAETRSERTKLIFHTAAFQLIFLVLAFFVLTSSGSLLGRGLVLAFLLHLVTDQLVDLVDAGSVSNWLKNFPVNLSGKEKIYLGGNLLVLLIFAFLL